MPKIERFLRPGEAGRCWTRAERRGRFDHSPRRLTELVALHVTQGRMRYLIDGRVLTLGVHTLLWAHTDQSHFLLGESDDFDMWVFVIAPALQDLSALAPPRRAADITSAGGARLLDPDASAELATVARAVRAADDPAFLDLGLRWWLARAWAAWQASAQMAGTQVHPAVQRAAELLRADPDVSVATVARKAGLSRSQLARVFKAATGRGLSGFRTEQRLAHVDAVMAASAAPSLLTAALNAGFGSYSQFYRAFHAARGQSPRTYYSA